MSIKHVIHMTQREAAQKYGDLKRQEKLIRKQTMAIVAALNCNLADLQEPEEEEPSAEEFQVVITDQHKE